MKVREGQPVTVTARIPGIGGGLCAAITVGRGDQARSARMIAGAHARRIHDHAEQHRGVVSVRRHRRIGAVENYRRCHVIRPVRVSRIDLGITYAPGVVIDSHTEEDGGDIYAPAGTKVELAITTDKPGRARRVDNERRDRRLRLNGHDQVLTADLVVVKGRFLSASR